MGRQQQADVRFEQTLRAIGFAVLNLQKANVEDRDGGVRVTDVRFKLDADNRTSVLVVVKGISGDGARVAFTGAADLEGAVIRLGKSLAGGSLRWREDRPWGSSGG